LTIAGDFYLEIGNREKAATCYGKAIVRHLMIDDVDTAKILVNKGVEYGFTSATYQFKMALNALDRKTSSLQEELQATEKDLKEIEEILPEIDLIPLDEEEDLIPLETEKMLDDFEVRVNRHDFIVSQLETYDPSKMSSFSVMAAVSNKARKGVERKIMSDAVVRDKQGETKFIESKSTLIPIKEDSISKDKHPADATTSKPKSEVVKDLELTSEEKLKVRDSVESDYSAMTEITNEYEEELVNIEVVDTIPYKWQVVDIQTDFNLDKEKKTDEGIVFSWKAEKLNPGEKATVEYVLRKRIERSIILRKQNRVSVLNSYHSLHQNLEANLNFINTSGESLEEVLIEDVIPPELIVNSVDSPQNIRPLSIPTHDSTLYRWIFSHLPPGDNFTVDYTFKEKPLTRHYRNIISVDNKDIIIEKISQPIIDSLKYEYLWIYAIDNPSDQNVTLIDRIPSDFEISIVSPLHYQPSMAREKTNTLLTWDLDSQEKKSTILIRLQGNESFTPLSPTFKLSGFEGIQLLESTSESEKKMIDIRLLIEKQEEET
jgi:hypothetical protein